ncbi:MAG: DNA polymerase III subunit delta [Rhizobiales bacterium]|nr:DNA polymerase III subunit delta [Hyphomicrobiales bacterium]
MVAVKAGDADAFVARPDPARPVVLVYGPDAGLVHERAETLIRNAVDDPSDPFLLARIEADEIAANSMRLVEEAQTIPMFGGRRAVWVRAGGRFNVAPSVEALLALPAIECRIVIEAGDLRRNAPLRAICERARQAAAIACYADDEKALGRLVDRELREAGLTLAHDARATLLPLLGGDRQASRSELGKLILYTRGKDRIEVEDVAAVVANASALTVDAAIDAALAGRFAELEREFAKLMAAGTSLGQIFWAGQRQLSELHKLRLAMDDGATVDAVVESARPPVYFQRKPQIKAALRIWTAVRLADAMVQFGKAALDARVQGDLAEPIAQRALMAIASQAQVAGKAVRR